ncbi:MAG: ABC transporter ATP-binding protein [candidate division Zixibacteria bacterium]
MKIKYGLAKIDFGSLRRVISHFAVHLKPHKGKLILSTFALLGMSAMTLLRPWPLKIIFDYALMPDRASDISFLNPLKGWDPMTVIFLAAGSILSMALISSSLEYAQSVWAKTVGHAVLAAIRLQLFSHVQRLPQSYHDYSETGEIITRLTGDINLLQDLMVETLIRLVGQFVLIFGMLSVAFFLDWQLALLILAVMPLFVIAAFKFTGRIKSAANRQREKYGKMVASMEESISGISQVKAFAQEKIREKLIGKSISSDFRANLRTTKLAANYARVVEIVTAVGTGIVLLIGAHKALEGNISPGDLIIFVTYLRGIYRPIRTVASLSARTSKAIVRGEKIMEILDIHPEVEDHPGAKSAKRIKGNIKFEDVYFSYIDGNEVLKGMNLFIPAGKTTVLIGSTGAGKSTIAKLLLRLYEAQAGAIYIDKRDIGEYRIRSLRKRVTSLTQDSFLFRTTIEENISFGKSGATREEIEEAARLVGADGFIEKFSEGYETLVGEGGDTLSGGQRQRISFARAALKNSPIMIFDEPATGLDIHSEKGAIEALRALKPGRTLLIITHRLNFLELADWAAYIEDGRLIEQGTVEELLKRKGEFYYYLDNEAAKPPEEIPEGTKNAKLEDK